MKHDKINDILISKNIVIPLYIYKMLPKLNIDLESFMFLMYLYSGGDKFIFDSQKITDEFGIDTKQLFVYIDKLSTAGLLNIQIEKNDKNISEEYLNLNPFIEKISLFIISGSGCEKKELDKSIFDKIEKEFGRLLSPIEYEIIKAWHENDISDELINEALKEAVFNGVSNLRYLDKILYEWQKKGYKTLEDIENSRKSIKVKNEKTDIFEYNWLEDDE